MRVPHEPNVPVGRSCEQGCLSSRPPPPRRVPKYCLFNPEIPPPVLQDEVDEEGAAQKRHEDAHRHLVGREHDAGREGRTAPRTPRRTRPKSGSTQRLSWPTKKRTRCGTMSPTNPSSPRRSFTATPASTAANPQHGQARRAHVHAERVGRVVAERHDVELARGHKRRGQTGHDVEGRPPQVAHEHAGQAACAATSRSAPM